MICDLYSIRWGTDWGGGLTIVYAASHEDAWELVSEHARVKHYEKQAYKLASKLLVSSVTGAVPSIVDEYANTG